MTIDLIIRDKVLEATEKIYGQALPVESVQVQNTRKEFEGDLTIVVFPFLRFSKKIARTNRRRTGQLPATER